MSQQVHPRRAAARGFFESLESSLQSDDVLADKRCVQMLIDKAAAEQTARSRKRFDPSAAFRTKVLYDKMDEAIRGWCQRRDIRTDPYNVLRYGGSERGPTQHETGLGPSLSFIERTFDRLVEAAPEIPDQRASVSKRADQAIAPGFRLQHPLPFGAAGEVVYDGVSKDLERNVYLVALYAATGGDAARGWRYDCGLLLFYGHESPRALLGPERWEGWPDLRERVWNSARVWVILL